MPLRSEGCHLCRKRKIRCDGTRPGCTKCSVYGVECPGYRNEKPGQVEFRDQTDSTAERAKVYVSRRKEVVTKPNSSIESRTNVRPDLSALPTSDAFCQTLSWPLVSLMLYQSPAVHRKQLYNKFLDLYLPQTVLPLERCTNVTHFDYLRTLATSPPNHSIVLHGIDALSLVQVGSFYKDPRLLYNAVQSYGKALNALSKALQSPQNIYDDGVLATAVLLGQCEMYDEIKQQGQGWVGHQQGVQQILDLRGPDSLNSRLSTQLYYASRNSSLARSLITRKADFYGSREWHNVGLMIPEDEPYYDAHNLGLRLPTLLERHDDLKASDSTDSHELAQLLDDFGELEAHMRSYLGRMHERAAGGAEIKACFVEKDIEHFTIFCKLVTDRTIATAFEFPNFTAAYLHSQYWLRMYLLRASMQSLHASSRQEPLDPCLSVDSDDGIEQELSQYILNLCRCIPYLVEPENAATGDICCFFPLRLAAKYFASNRHWSWLAWVHAVNETLFHKGISAPDLGTDDVALTRSNSVSTDHMDLGDDTVGHHLDIGSRSLGCTISRDTKRVCQIA